MSKLFRGKAIFKPLNTGRIDARAACVREWVANIFFYTKNGTTVMIDAGYKYERLREKMGWLDIDPASIQHIFITHQDTDHVGALERDSELLFKNAPIVLLDEATASLDVENETKVQGALSRLLAGKTVLVIAHRMRTVEAADRIVVLADGKVAEEGSPDELLAKEDGIFRRMTQLQSASAGWSI